MPDSAAQPPDMDRLRWQCRRGMLELDEILSRFLETRFATASDSEQADFRALLAIEDPVLNEWLLLGQAEAAGTLAEIVERVRAG